MENVIENENYVEGNLKIYEKFLNRNYYVVYSFLKISTIIKICELLHFDNFHALYHLKILDNFENNIFQLNDATNGHIFWYKFSLTKFFLKNN